MPDRFVWEEDDLVFLPRKDQKGGPGSGHWGHAGRPGQVGGSIPGAMAGHGRVNREYFTKGPGRKIVEGLTDAEREGAITQLTGFRVQPRHLAGLRRISTAVPEDNEKTDFHSDWTFTDIETGEKGELQGCYTYATGIINIKSKFLTEDTSQRVQAGESWRSFASHVLAHELGHHVTLGESVWKGEARHLLENGLDHMIEKGRAGKIKRKRLWSAGLRPYSLSKRAELRADVWKIYQFGGKTQRKTLAQLMGVKSLDVIFMERE